MRKEIFIFEMWINGTLSKERNIKNRSNEPKSEIKVCSGLFAAHFACGVNIMCLFFLIFRACIFKISISSCQNVSDSLRFSHCQY